MNFNVAVSGRPWQVDIEPLEQRGQFAVVVKGQKRIVDATWIDGDTLLLIDGSVAREVRIHPRQGAALGVAFGGAMFDVVVDRRRQKRDRATVGVVSGDVTSPMPGRIVRVLVAVGDRVSARQPLVVVEAMKMENELRAAMDGVVKEVNVQEGAAIDTGTVLVVIE